MKRKFLLLTLSAGIISLTLTSYNNGPFQGGAGNRTGSAGSPANCNTGGCHDANNASLNVTVSLLDNWVPVTTYQVGKTYRVLISGVVPGTTRPRFGFQLSCVKSASTTTQAGTLSIGSRPNIALRTIPGALQLVEHTSPILGTVVGTTVVDTVSFNWVASTSLGKVKFFAALNAVNFNNATTGDMPNVTTAEFDEATTGVPSVSNSALRVYPNPASNELHIPLSSGYAADISIVDATGRAVLRQTATANMVGEANIFLRELAAGTYYALVLQDGKLSYAQFVKN